MITYCFSFLWYWAVYHKKFQNEYWSTPHSCIWYKTAFFLQTTSEQYLQHMYLSFCSPACLTTPRKVIIPVFKFSDCQNSIYPEKFLDIMLHKWIQRFPTETFGQFLCTDRFVAKLEFMKDSLQGQSNRLGRIIGFCWHFVNSFPQLICKIESLQ